MLRNLAVLMSTLVAMSAQAEDASTPTAPATTGNQREPAVAAQHEERGHPLSPTAKRAQPDAGVDATTPDEPNDCGMEDSFVAEQPPPFAIRVYESLVTAASPEQGIQPRVGEVPPSVSRAGRCGPKYVIQIKSESKEPFEVKDAKLVGVDGEVLHVIRTRSRVKADKTSINIITVERTQNVSEPDYRVAAILLIGKDGRGFVIESLLLP